MAGRARGSAPAGLRTCRRRSASLRPGQVWSRHRTRRTPRDRALSAAGPAESLRGYRRPRPGRGSKNYRIADLEPGLGLLAHALDTAATVQSWMWRQAAVPTGRANENGRPKAAVPNNIATRLLGVALLELVDAAAGVHDLVLARVERVRGRGD